MIRFRDVVREARRDPFDWKKVYWTETYMGRGGNIWDMVVAIDGVAKAYRDAVSHYRGKKVFGFQDEDYGFIPEEYLLEMFSYSPMAVDIYKKGGTASSEKEAMNLWWKEYGIHSFPEDVVLDPPKGPPDSWTDEQLHDMGALLTIKRQYGSKYGLNFYGAGPLLRRYEKELEVWA